jgi:phage terminase large subunit-like protein
MEAFCRHSKGEWAGQPLRLAPWQRTLVNELMAVGPDGRRRHRIGYVGLPRKNGKSTLGAALALYGLLADGEPGSEIYSCAGDRRQAEIVFGEAKRMVSADPELAGVIKVQRYHLEGPDNSIYRVLSADAALQQGLNPSFVIFDEVHVQPNENLWNAMTLGSGTRRQPLIVGLTTAGFHEGTLAYRLYEYGRNIAAGVVDDPTFFFRWYEAPADAPYRDPATWALANPALSGKGAFLKADDFEAAVRTTTEGPFRRFRLNQWTQAEELWLPAGAWDACDDVLELDPRLPVAVGIDLALTHDTTAIVVAQRQGERIVLRAHFWANPFPPGHSEHDEWELEVSDVMDELRSLRRTFPKPAARLDGRTRDGPAFCYDPWGFREAANTLWHEGLAMVEVPQTNERLGPATREFYDAVLDRRIAHDGDPTLAAHLRNVVAVPLGDHGWRLRKITRTSARKIDGAVAAVMAVHQALQPAPPQRVGAFFAVTSREPNTMAKLCSAQVRTSPRRLEPRNVFRTARVPQSPRLLATCP